jgi:hypothetical protein
MQESAPEGFLHPGLEFFDHLDLAVGESGLALLKRRYAVLLEQSCFLPVQVRVGDRRQEGESDRTDRDVGEN